MKCRRDGWKERYWMPAEYTRCDTPATYLAIASIYQPLITHALTDLLSKVLRSEQQRPRRCEGAPRARLCTEVGRTCRSSPEPRRRVHQSDQGSESLPHTPDKQCEDHSASRTLPSRLLDAVANSWGTKSPAGLSRLGLRWRYGLQGPRQPAEGKCRLPSLAVSTPGKVALGPWQRWV